MVRRLSQRIAGVVVGGLILTAAVTGVAAGQASEVDRAPAPLLAATDSFVLFSPNGDHRKDKGRFGFRLVQPATMTATVRRNGDIIRGPVPLGRLGSGRQVWRWDGENNRGRTVADGSYRVTLKASRTNQKETLRVDAEVATVFAGGNLRMTRATIYPRATVVDDRVLLVFLQPDWSPFTEEFDLDVLPRTELEVRNPNGKTIYRKTIRNRVTPALTWDGVRDNGKVARAGTYKAHLAIRDAAGNTGNFHRRIEVSDAQLVEQVHTETMPAAQAGTYEPYFGGCNGCGEFCAPAASSRFVDGLSFGPCAPFARTLADFSADVPFPEAPVDSFRITATGAATGPTGSDQGAVGLTSTGPGGTTTTTPWQQVRLTHYPYLPDQTHPIVWNFHTEDANSYDVATFTIEYRHYLPAPTSQDLAG